MTRRPFAFTSFPIMTLLDSEDESHTIPGQSIFRLNNERTELKGTLMTLEPVEMALYQEDNLKQGLYSLCHGPEVNLRLPTVPLRTPTWISLCHFKSDNVALCHMPIDDREPESFTETLRKSPAFKNTSDHADFLLEEGYHLIGIDFTRKRPPGTHQFRKSAELWRYAAANDVGPLDIYRIAV